MWWEIIPPMAIIGTCLWAPQIGTKYLHLAVFGNPFRRSNVRVFDQRMFQRDTYIDGAPWKVRGLENIPDL